jgi:hypothetical protein
LDVIAHSKSRLFATRFYAVKDGSPTEKLPTVLTGGKYFYISWYLSYPSRTRNWPHILFLVLKLRLLSSYRHKGPPFSVYFSLTLTLCS